MREESIFAEAVQIAEVERAAYLERACGGDVGLRQQVEALLAAHGESNVLDRPAVEVSRTAPYQPPSTEERPGTVVGPYKLLQELGEGGFGVVFMAEQQEPVRRRVALKIIKPGMDSKQVLARFEQERQALAMMDHPNIARILDAGATESGRPYFVMELVKGVPITRFCDENRLGTRERLELFTQVCSAIQHAHTKGIIHRDVKPSNVLVALYDGKAVPKVIDFGIAKAIEQRLTEQTLFTRVGQVIGTFEYMSPEQATMNQLDVDTRSDVYALGVLLYELLTGFTPLDKERLRTLALDEMLRAIREEEPPRPSTRLSNSGGGLPLAASYRGTESRKLTDSMRGELDWIALKALEKDRSRRYQSATGLAEDVGRYLRDEQVIACPPSWGYRAGKYLRKHKGALTLAGTAAVLLLLGIIVSGWQAWRATRAEHVALNKAEEAEEARKAEAELREVAARRGEQLRHNQYGLAMNSVQTAVNAGNFTRAVELLEQQCPGPGEEDLRHFEWHYWDRRLNQQLRSVHLTGGVPSALSGDGQRVASWTQLGPEEDPLLTVVETSTNRVLFRYALDGKDEMDGFAQQLSLSHDGRRVACLLTEKREKVHVVVFDVTTGKRLFAHQVRGMGWSALARFALDRSGRQLATIERVVPTKVPGPPALTRVQPHETLVQIWNVDAPNGKPIIADKKQMMEISPPAFSPDGTRLAIVSYPRFIGGGTSTVHVWDTKGGHLQTTPEYQVAAVAFSPDGNRLAGLATTLGKDAQNPSVERGLQTLLWDCSADKLQPIRATPLARTEGGSMASGQLAYGPAGQLAVWGTSVSGVRILDAATGEESRNIESGIRAAHVAFDKDGGRLLTVGLPRIRAPFDQYRIPNDGLIWQEWDVKPRKPAAVARPAENVVRSRDGERQAAYRAFSRDEKGPITISVRDRDGKEIHVFRGHQAASMRNVRFSRDGRLIYSHADREVRIWEADTGTVLYNYNVEEDDVASRFRAAAFSADGRLMLRPGREPKVIRFEQGLSELFSVGPYESADFSPDGRRLVTSERQASKNDGPGGRADPLNYYSEIRLWDVEAGRLIGTLPAGTLATFSPGGGCLVIGSRSGSELSVCDPDTGKVRFVLKGETLTFRSPVFSRDGTRLLAKPQAFGSEQTTPVVWDLTTGRSLFRLEGTGRMGNSAFSPDGKRIATVAGGRGWQMEVKVWDASTGREMLSVSEVARGPSATLVQVRFSDDGHRVIFGGPRTNGPDLAVIDATPRREGEP